MFFGQFENVVCYKTNIWQTRVINMLWFRFFCWDLLSRTSWFDDEIVAGRPNVATNWQWKARVRRRGEGGGKKRRDRHTEIINSGCIWLFDSAWLWFTAIFIFIQISLYTQPLSLSLSSSLSFLSLIFVWLCKTPFTAHQRGSSTFNYVRGNQTYWDRIRTRIHIRKRTALFSYLLLTLFRSICHPPPLSCYLCVLF